MEKGAALQAEFDAAAPCEAHSQFRICQFIPQARPLLILVLLTLLDAQ